MAVKVCTAGASMEYHSHAALQGEGGATWHQDVVHIPRCFLERRHGEVDGGRVEPAGPEGAAHWQLQV